MGTLYLIDGYAQFFRAYHAIRTPMTSPVTREPTNMTFGFVGMLLKLLGQAAGDDAVAVAMDVSGDRGTFRSVLYPAYKATRSEPPADLEPQVRRAVALLEAVGVPTVGVEGFEADDVIATMVEGLRRGVASPPERVRIISKDKDLKQLLNGDAARGPIVELFDIHTDLVIDEAKLREETSLRPDQVVDMLALMGDTVDNVPGVPGIGPATSAKLIAEFGTLDAVIAEAMQDGPASAQRIKGKQRENIRASVERLPLSKELVTLRRDAGSGLEGRTASVASLRLGALMPILQELGFNRYQDDVRRLMGGEASSAGVAPGSTGDAARGGPRGSASGPAPEAPATPVVRKRASREKPDREQTLLFGGAAGGATATADATMAPPAARESTASYRTVRTAGDLSELVAELRGCDVFAFDTETTHIRPTRAELVGMSFSTRAGTGWYVPVRSPSPGEHLGVKQVLGALGPLLEDGERAKCGHNIKYDLIVMRGAGVRLRGFERSPGGDSMIASYLLDASRSSHSMDALALALLGHRCIAISELIGSGRDQRRFDEVPLGLASEYAAEDADITLRLCEAQHRELAGLGLEKLYREVELPLVRALAELEVNGVLVDRAELGRQRERLTARQAEVRRAIHEASMSSLGRVFEIDSPKQLSQALFNKASDEPAGLGLASVKRTKTGHSTDAEVLEKLEQDASVTTPIPRLVLEHRQLGKLVGTYLVALDEEIDERDGRIHASFNQTVAATGRLSSSDPNLQNIPIRTEIGREIRRAFVAPAGRVLISADYSQVELRLLAHLSRDPGLIAAFEAGEDIHRAVAAQIHGVALAEVTREQRSGAKMVNFGIVYGITSFGLARRLGVSQEEAGRIIAQYKARFAGITTFLEECVQQARSHGHVATMLSRRRPIPDIESNVPARRALAERTAINTVVQGSAADLIKLAMVRIQGEIDAARERVAVGGSPSAEHAMLAQLKPLLQIHDELVFECDGALAEPARAYVVERMRGAMSLTVPIEVDSHVSTDWFDGK